MTDLTIAQMQEMQRELQQKYRSRWKPLCPENGKRQLLWMMIEAGEIADIIKKKGDQKIMDDPEVRKHFTEEICDVLMYLSSVMMCYDISPEEVSETFYQKHQRNMQRW